MSETGDDDVLLAETQLWSDLILWFEDITAQIERALLIECGLSVAEFQVLDALHRAGGSLPQQVVGEQLRWSASRLSHQIRRMRDRSLVDHTAVGEGRRMSLALTTGGAAAIRAAEPVHRDAVRRHLLAQITPVHRLELRAALARSRAAGASVPDGDGGPPPRHGAGD